MKKIIKIITISLLMICLIVLTASVATTQNEISAENICKEFRLNPVRVEKLYPQGTTIITTGQITNIESKRLYPGQEYIVEMFPSSSCELDAHFDESKVKQVIEINIGQTIKTQCMLKDVRKDKVSAEKCNINKNE